MAMGINSSLSMLNASIGVNDSQKVLSDAVKKIADGKKTAASGFDPGAALVSEKLNPGLMAADRAVSANEKASNVARVADDAAGKIGDLLKEAKNILSAASKGEGGGLKEVSANNKRLNEIVNTISQVADTARFGKTQVFDGTQAITAPADGNGQAATVKVPKLNAESLGTGATYAGGEGGAAKPVAQYGSLEGIKDALTTGNSDKISQALGVVEKAIGQVGEFQSQLDKVSEKLSANSKTDSTFQGLQTKNATANDQEKVRELSKVTMENIRSQVKMALMAQGKDNSQNLFQLLL